MESLPSEGVFPARNLPSDLLHLIADQTDWKSTNSLCLVLRCFQHRGYWKRRTISEFGEDSWSSFYQSEFHNYLAARVSSYLKMGNRVEEKDLQEFKFAMKPKGHLTPADLGVRADQIMRSDPRSLSTDQMRTILRKIKRHAKDAGETLPEVLFNSEGIRRYLRAYFDLDEEDQRAREVIQISRFLVTRLEVESPETFRVKTIEVVEGHFDEKLQTVYHRDEKITEVTNSKIHIEEHSLLPSNILRINRNGRCWGYLHYYCDGKLYFVCDYDSHEGLSASFKEQMRKLGICPLHYDILYPGVKFCL